MRARAEEKNPVILMLSTADWDATLWTNKQHQARAFRDRGYIVFYVESMGLRAPSLMAGRDLRRLARRARRMVTAPRVVEAGIIVWSPPAIPLQRFAPVRAFNRLAISSLLRVRMAQLKLRPSLVWTYSPLTLRLFRVRSDEQVVYHCVDDFSAQDGLDGPLLGIAEQELAQRAVAVFVTNKNLLARFDGHRLLQYYPNCIDSALFASASAGTDPLVELPRPRVGFVGAVAAYKVDVDMLRSVFRSRSDWSLVLIGPREDKDKGINSLIALPNVHHIGTVHHRDVPLYMRSLDVGIIPAVVTDYTRSMFPMKFFEYLASGLPVVATSIPALLEYSDAAELVDDPEGFEGAIARAVAGECPPVQTRQAAVEDNSYAKRTEKMLQDLAAIGVQP